MRSFAPIPNKVIGREDLINRVVSFLIASAQNNNCCLFLLHRPHGVGKTTALRAIAAQLKDILKSQHCFLSTTESSLLADIGIFLSFHGCRKSDAAQFKAFEKNEPVFLANVC